MEKRRKKGVRSVAKCAKCCKMLKCESVLAFFGVVMGRDILQDWAPVL